MQPTSFASSVITSPIVNTSQYDSALGRDFSPLPIMISSQIDSDLDRQLSSDRQLSLNCKISPLRKKIKRLDSNSDSDSGSVSDSMPHSPPRKKTRVLLIEKMGPRPKRALILDSSSNSESGWSRNHSSSVTMDIGERGISCPQKLKEEIPAVEVPAVEVPAVEVPAVEVPAVEVPAVEVQAVEVPAIDTEVTQWKTPKLKLKYDILSLYETIGSQAEEMAELQAYNDEQMQEWRREKEEKKVLIKEMKALVVRNLEQRNQIEILKKENKEQTLKALSSDKLAKLLFAEVSSNHSLAIEGRDKEEKRIARLGFIKEVVSKKLYPNGLVPSYSNDKKNFIHKVL